MKKNAFKKSVLFIALDCYSRIGGLQAFNRRLSENLGSLAFEDAIGQPHIYCMEDKIDALSIELNAIYKGFGGSRLRFSLFSIIKSLFSDIILVGHINLLPLAWLSKIICPHLYVILFVHGDEVWNEPHRPKKWFESYMLNSINIIASVSQFTADIMAREYGVQSKRFIIFPNAVDDLKTLNTFDHKHETILTVTRMEEGDRLKNIDMLIRAVAILISNDRDVRLEIVGGGALRGELEALARNYNTQDHVAFLGRLSDEDLDRAYHRAKIFALPSSKEGFGIVFLEAWQRGLPVICGMRGASHEIVTDGVDGLVADERAVEDIAEKIAFLLDHPEEASAMGDCGRRKVQELYSAPQAKARLRTLLGIA